MTHMVSCSDIQWEIAMAFFTEPGSSIPVKVEQAAQAIEECQASHLGDECEICRASD